MAEIISLDTKPVSGQPSLPDYLGLLHDAAGRLKEDRKYLAASTAIKRALALEPANPVLLGTFGAICWNLCEYKTAIDALTRSIDGNPNDANTWANLGLTNSSLNRWEESERCFRRSLELKPDNLGTRWDMAIMNLARGQWQSGFDEYEVRVKFRGEPFYPKLPYEFWNGEDLTGRTLVVVAEQGVGDCILFSRYLPMLRHRYRAMKVKYFVQPRLHDLMWEFRHTVEFCPPGIPWPEADFGIFAMSLPKMFGTTLKSIPADPGLLLKRAMAQKNSVNLPVPHRDSLKVGVCWTGNPNNAQNDDRSIPLEMVLELAENPDVTLYSLQVGPGADHLQFVGCDDLIKDLSKPLAAYGYAGTAGVMLNLDLVITVCTSVAHLAGALDVPCWTMLCHDPYWVWLHDREDSVWYPSMRLFRQPHANDWRSVIDQVKRELAIRASDHLTPAKSASV